MQCTFIRKTDGSRCRAQCILGQDKCLWHIDRTIRQEIEEKPLTRDEQIKVISHRIRSLERSRGSSSLEKAREVRALVTLLRDMQADENKLNAGEDEEENAAEYIEKKYGKK